MFLKQQKKVNDLFFMSITSSLHFKMVGQHITAILVTASLKLLEWVREWFLLPEEPGSDYKPSDTSAVQNIVIDGGKGKPDEEKDAGLSNDRVRWGFGFLLLLNWHWSCPVKIPFYRTLGARIDSLNSILGFPLLFSE